jgi:hypothetical protein
LLCYSAGCGAENGSIGFSPSTFFTSAGFAWNRPPVASAGLLNSSFALAPKSPLILTSTGFPKRSIVCSVGAGLSNKLDLISFVSEGFVNSYEFAAGLANKLVSAALLSAGLLNNPASPVG